MRFVSIGAGERNLKQRSGPLSGAGRTEEAQLGIVLRARCVCIGRYCALVRDHARRELGRERGLQAFEEGVQVRRDFGGLWLV